MDKHHERVLAGLAVLCGLTALINFGLAGRTHLFSLSALHAFELWTVIVALATALLFAWLPAAKAARLEPVLALGRR